jgi:hypothetical protein
VVHSAKAGLVVHVVQAVLVVHSDQVGLVVHVVYAVLVVHSAKAGLAVHATLKNSKNKPRLGGMSH